MNSRTRAVAFLALLVASVTSLAVATTVSAHSGTEVGEYLVSVGWKNEPAFVGQPNGVQVTVVHHDDESPVLDGVDLGVVVETGGQSTETLPVAPAFDAEEETGALGEYGAAIVPTAPGDYTFHITGTIADTAVDLSIASGDETFDPVVGSSDAEFPVRLPNLGEVATRLDRIDARIAALASADPGTAALDAAQAALEAARAATDAANRAVLLGVALGAAGIAVGLVGVLLALRAGRRSGDPG